MERKMFTVREANRAIPWLTRLMEELQEGLRWLNVNRQTVSHQVAEYRFVNESPVNPIYFQALIRIRKALKEIQQAGAQVKDVNSGLVDFPARLYGKEILLCWRLGEDQVKFWHDLDAGFAGRQLLPSGDLDSGTEEEGN